MREKKKRGKASRKDLAQRTAAAAALAAAAAHHRRRSPPKTRTPSEPSDVSKGGSRASSLPSEEGDRVADYANRTRAQPDAYFAPPPDLDALSQQPRATHRDAPVQGQQMPVAVYPAFSPDFDRNGLQVADMGRMAAKAQQYANCTSELSLGLTLTSHGGFEGESAMVGGYPMANVASPGWGVALSPLLHDQFQTTAPYPEVACPDLRYPVLEPLVVHLDSVKLSPALACDLLDLYFSSSSAALPHPASPYVLAFVFRKASLLHPTSPRKCQPALLASMLWVAAQTSDAAVLTSLPSARAITCQRLLDLTLRLLKPLVHVPADGACSSADAALAALTLGGLGTAVPGPGGMDAMTAESGPLGGAGGVDDVVTYVHLATVSSAGEYKGASLRWWTAAWSLARELKLGRELRSGHPSQAHEGTTADAADGHGRWAGSPGEEEREERRRIWWLLYIVDRHAALCYNRPLALLDVECEGLLRPMDEAAWQRGGSSCGCEAETAMGCASGAFCRGARATGGPGRFECRGLDIFGYFLPLMTILGEIVDLQHARNHPRLGVGLRGPREWDEQALEIGRHMDLYEQSLTRLEERQGLGGEQGGGGGEATSPAMKGASRMGESEVHSRTVAAYGTQMVHVLHILLAGKWDPIGLLDDHDMWVSSQAFAEATRHAVSAAEATAQILEYDPGLELMPFFFGFYLVQGSIPLVLMADQLRQETTPAVARACETVVRAHEACVVTLSSEYQVSMEPP